MTEEKKLTRTEIIEEVERLEKMIRNPSGYKLENDKNIDFNAVKGMKKRIEELTEEFKKLPVEPEYAGYKELFSEERLIARTECNFYLLRSKNTKDTWKVVFTDSQYRINPRVECDSTGRPTKLLFDVVSSETGGTQVPYFIELAVDYVQPKATIETPVRKEQPIKFPSYVQWVCKFCGRENQGLDNEKPETRICSSCMKRQDEEISSSDKAKGHKSILDKLRGK